MSGRLMPALRGDATLHKDDMRRLRSDAVGGVILFARNFSDSAQLRRLTAAIRRAAAPRPVLIAADQEGGRVQRFRGGDFTGIPAMADIAAAAGAEELAAAAGFVLAAELLAHGVDLTFAPVLDIAHGNSEIIGARAFSADAETTAALGARLVAGLRRGGMAACGKHFPGHGYAAADSHAALPADGRARETMRACDWLPFTRLAAGGIPALMTAHIVYPAVDADAPATFSPVWLRQILREELGFRGLVVCDDLSMAGAASAGDMAMRIGAADAAGCDLFLVCQAEDLDDAVIAVERMGGGDNRWRALSYADMPREGVGDDSYRRAREVLARMHGADAAAKS